MTGRMRPFFRGFGVIALQDKTTHDRTIENTFHQRPGVAKADGKTAEKGIGKMDSDGQKTGKAQVRELLIERLQGAGMVRPKGQSVAAHEAFHERLVEQLAYMDEENLRTLAETLIDVAQGGVWPSEVLIRQYARALQAPPIQQHRIVSSWLASVEGPMAEAGGYLVELYRFLIRHARPPLAMDMRLIREMAERNARQAHLAHDRIRRGVAQEEDRVWLSRYRADQAEAQRIVDEGARRRAEGERAAG